LKALKIAVYILFKGNKKDNQKQEESFLKVEEDINKDKEELVSSIIIYYTCIKALIS
jgi:hypothetical protein